jgi:hypothetical protein
VGGKVPQEAIAEAVRLAREGLLEHATEYSGARRPLECGLILLDENSLRSQREFLERGVCASAR